MVDNNQLSQDYFRFIPSRLSLSSSKITIVHFSRFSQNLLSFHLFLLFLNPPPYILYLKLMVTFFTPFFTVRKKHINDPLFVSIFPTTVILLPTPDSSFTIALFPRIFLIINFVLDSGFLIWFFMCLCICIILFSYNMK